MPKKPTKITKPVLLSKEGQKTSHLETRDPRKLIPYANNARTHSEEQVALIIASIEERGFINPIIIDENDMILAGHGRQMALRALDWDSVPCVVMRGWSEPDKKKYVLADNKIALNSHWDEDKLHEELARLSQESVTALDGLGFSGEELESLLQPPIEDDPTAREQPSTLQIKVGTKTIVPCSAQEMAGMKAAINEYVDEFSVKHGFVGRLCDALELEL